MISSNNFKEITATLRDISNQASKKILEIYNSNFEIKFKDDKSPLTMADTESNRIICSKLTKEFPKIPIISEENKNKRLNIDTYFLVDPLDGTKEFISRNGEFTVNIALIFKNQPKLGVIKIPTQNTQYFSDGFSSFKYNRYLKKIFSNSSANKIKFLTSRSHLDFITESIIKSFRNAHLNKVGSSLKFCYLAEGKADIYIRNGNTMCWDVGAGIAILKTAGCDIKTLDLKKFVLNRENFINESFVSFKNTFSNEILKYISKQYKLNS
tara:strand:+ start:1288 stop:2091 length:804 start_codon:yes stop_codon:yes gene_type:complete